MTVPLHLRLGTRRSALARTQSTQMAERLRALGHTVELVEIVTEGDRDRATPLRHLGGTGVFVSALRAALRQGRVDLAVHSLKDLPTNAEEDLVLAAVPSREDPRDALVSRAGARLADLRPGARVGTGSPRRRAQLLALGTGLDVRDLRGNVDTRLAAVTRGDLDAVILAAAGLRRLGRADVITEALDPALMLPAPGQGALAIETYAARPEVAAALAALDDPATRACVTAERAVLATLEAGCSAPVGALARIVSVASGPSTIEVEAVVAAADGSALLRRRVSAPMPEVRHGIPTPDGPAHRRADGTSENDLPVALGTRLAHLLLDDGAAALVPDLARSQTTGLGA